MIVIVAASVRGVVTGAVGTDGAMTALADNPPVNAADTDLSIASAGLFIGLLRASASYLITRPTRRMSLGRDPSDPVSAAEP